MERERTTENAHLYARGRPFYTHRRINRAGSIYARVSSTASWRVIIHSPVSRAPFSPRLPRSARQYKLRERLCFVSLRRVFAQRPLVVFPARFTRSARASPAAPRPEARIDYRSLLHAKSERAGGSGSRAEGGRPFSACYSGPRAAERARFKRPPSKTRLARRRPTS